MAELSNNPFIDHTSAVASRFPSIDAMSSSVPNPSALPYSTGWPQQQQQQQQQPSYQSSSGYVGANPTGYNQQYYQQSQWPQQQQPQQAQYQSQLQTYSPAGYQSPSPYGQQYVGQVNSLATGYPQQQQQQLQSQYTGYPTQQQPASYSYQQQQQPTGYGYPQPQPQQHQLLAQFDPYANANRSQQLSPPQAGATLPPTSSASPASFGPSPAAPSPPGMQHPRIFIRGHKVELEAWDPQTWRQVQSSFDSLKTAWETRKHAAEAQVRALGGTVGAPPGAGASGFFGAGPMGGYGGAYGVYQTPQAQEIDRLNAVLSLSCPFYSRFFLFISPSPLFSNFFFWFRVHS